VEKGFFCSGILEAEPDAAILPPVKQYKLSLKAANFYIPRLQRYNVYADAN
jgi:hypothetical protein